VLYLRTFLSPVVTFVLLMSTSLHVFDMMIAVMLVDLCTGIQCAR
jgi:hypothetical protein